MWPCLLLAIALRAPVAPSNRIESCFDCLLGLYDDAARTASVGSSTPGVLKSIYLGIDYAPGFGQLETIDFSISGMRSDLDGIDIIDVEGIVPPIFYVGSSIAAPADTSATSTQTGGRTYGWEGCLTGSRTLLRIRFVHYGPLVNKVFRVKRKYPPANPLVRTPLLFECPDDEVITVRLTGGCYVLNWNGDPEALECLDGPVALEPRSWSRLKALFR